MNSSHGLVVKAEDSWLRGCGFNPPLWRPFFMHHSFGSKHGGKNWVEINLALLHMLLSCKREGGQLASKIQLTKDELKACQLTSTKLPQKKLWKNCNENIEQIK
jgi:hypothetical protein